MIDHDKKVIYIHLPRTGGHSIRKVFSWKWDHFVWGESHYDYLTDEICSQYFMFTFVRNPFDRMVSLYWYWRERLNWNTTFDDFVLHFEKIMITETKYKTRMMELCHTWPQSHLNGHYNKWKFVDCVGRTENLTGDLSKIITLVGGVSDKKWNSLGKNCGYIGDEKHVPIINQKKNPSSMNKKIGPDNKHYSEYYTKTSKERVTEKYKEDLERFNYEFEGDLL
jgi:hypothetical protein